MFPGTTIDSVFEFERPEFLMYGGEEEDSELVGFAWFVHSPVNSLLRGSRVKTTGGTGTK